MNTRIRTRILPLIGVLLVILLITLTTTPDSVGPIGVVIFFGLVFLLFFLLFDFILWLMARRKGRESVATIGMLGSLAMVPTLVLALSSLNQLTWRDVLILVGFGVLALFYWSRRRV